MSHLSLTHRVLTAAVVLDSVSDGVQLLAAAAAQAMAPLQNRSARVVWAALRERFAALATEVNAGVVKVTSAAPAVTVVPASATAQRQVLAELLAGTARLAHENEHRGLAVCIDEFQEAPHEQLVVIANALQDAMGEADAPLVVFGAGLPGTPERVMAAASFTERFDFRVLDRLSDDDAERALLEPALGVGVGWAPEAAARVLAAAAGSPYLVQRFGDEAWGLADRATGSLITVAQAQVAVDDVRESLAQGMFRGRWAKASPAEQELMVAVAQVADPDGVARSRHYAAVAGRSTPQLSVARQGLIDKGLVEAAGHGRVRFTMPGFGEFVLDRVNLPALWPQIAATGTPPISGAITAQARPEPPHLPGSPSSPPVS